MDKPKPFQFVGGSYTSAAVNLDAQRSMNVFVETDETGQGKANAALYGTPGLTPFCLLPTSPIRAMLATDANRLFVVAGSHYYEVFTDATYVDRGVVGDDVTHSPAQIIPNGTQVMIVSAGQVWIDDGTLITAANYTNGTGTVTRSGGAITWISGSKFDASNIGNTFTTRYSGTCNTSTGAVTWVSGDHFSSSWLAAAGIVINDVLYRIFVVSSTTSLTLLSSAGTQTAVDFYIDVPYTVASVTDSTHLTLTTSPSGTQGATVTGTCTTVGTAVTWVSGAAFSGLWLPTPGVITINGFDYQLLDVTSITALDLATTAGTQATPVAFSVTIGVEYSSSYPVTASWGAFLDGYYIVSQPGTKQFNISAINNGKSWNTLDFGRKEGAPDGIFSLLADHEELWIFGSQTIEVWNDTGVAAFPLTRNASGFIPTGCKAPGSPVRLAGSVAWLGGDARGGPVAYMAQGFIPVRVSTFAVEAQWATFANIHDVISWTYNDGGHQFWVLCFGAADCTWVYDVTQKEWHERGWWNGSSFDMHRATMHAYFDNFAAYQHLVGDHITGQIYGMSMALLDDAGTPIHRIRSAPHVADRTLWNFYTQFTLDIQVGSGGTNVALDYSDDGGVTWNTPRLATVYGSRVLWRRLGRSRDRVFRISYSGTGRTVWIDAHLDYSEGTT